MISIIKAAIHDYIPIVEIGRVSVEESHRGSCPAEVLDEYLKKNYNKESIQEELQNEDNSYHIITVDGKPAGFSKIVLNAGHPNILQKNIAKLDRIYLLK